MNFDNAQTSQLQRSAEAALAEKDTHIKLLSDRAAMKSGEADQWKALAQARESRIKELESEVATLRADQHGTSE